MPIRDTTNVFSAYATEIITVADAAIGCTVAKLYDAVTAQAVNKITVDVEAQPIRYTLDGTAPTTSVGRPVAAGVAFEVYGTENIGRLRMIRSTGSSATVTVTYFY